ncbi:MAG: uracil-DNA glycosylase [Thermodesulfobacteriota bacterium]|nr:uracil-DNA glycosylase [Thermodesulfobacteriota bacterium]
MTAANAVQPADRVQSIVSLLEAAKGTLQYYAGAGCRTVSCDQETTRVLEQWTAPDCLTVRSLAPPAAAEAGICEPCPLSRLNARPMAAKGTASAGLMMIPGYPSRAAAAADDPFAGDDGALLARIITAGMQLDLGDVYVSYLVKCCPPPNTPPETDAVVACRRHLEVEIQAAAPKVICTLGAFASGGLLDTAAPLAELRAEPRRWRNITVVPTWHPADILSESGKKREVWEDVKTIMKQLGGGVNCG